MKVLGVVAIISSESTVKNRQADLWIQLCTSEKDYKQDSQAKINATQNHFCPHGGIDHFVALQSIMSFFKQCLYCALTELKWGRAGAVL